MSELNNIVVDSTRLRNEYDEVIVEVCKQLWNLVLDANRHVVNEKGEAVRLNISDVCNTVTNVAQKYRAEQAAEGLA